MFVAGHRMAADMRDLYLDRYRAIDPRRGLLAGASPGEWRLTQDHHDEAFLRRDPFYRDFAIPRGGGHGAVTYLDFGCFRGFVCLGRALRQGPFPDASRRRLAGLTPHLRRASMITAQAAAARSPCSSLSGRYWITWPTPCSWSPTMAGSCTPMRRERSSSRRETD